MINILFFSFDQCSFHILISAADDGTIRLWDTRVCSRDAEEGSPYHIKPECLGILYHSESFRAENVPKVTSLECIKELKVFIYADDQGNIKVHLLFFPAVL